jgi:DNA sulfur modification protein DndD
LSKKVDLEDTDKEKDAMAERLIDKLDKFINQLKLKKKISLEKSILREMNRLMHKDDFVSKVNVVISGDLIDIELYDHQKQFIDKELLSKGEQQLYATALLKALVDESNIRFPVFIDSPLQKFDKQHSRNIIQEFYPFLSGQVVLFPLLQKELNEQEYNWMLPRVGKAYLINQKGKYHSVFEQVNADQLFVNFNKTQEHVQ